MYIPILQMLPLQPLEQKQTLGWMQRPWFLQLGEQIAVEKQYMKTAVHHVV